LLQKLIAAKILGIKNGDAFVTESDIGVRQRMLGVQKANFVGSQTFSSVTGILSRCGSLSSLLLSVRFLRSSQSESVTEWELRHCQPRARRELRHWLRHQRIGPLQGLATSRAVPENALYVILRSVVSQGQYARGKRMHFAGHEMHGKAYVYPVVIR